MTCSGPNKEDIDCNEDLMVLRHALRNNKRQQLSLAYQHGDDVKFIEAGLGNRGPPDHQRPIGLNTGSDADSIITLVAPPVAGNQCLPNYSSHQVSKNGPLFDHSVRPSIMLDERGAMNSSPQCHSLLMSSNALPCTNRLSLLGDGSDILSYEKALFHEKMKNRQLMQLSIQQQQQLQQQQYQMTSPPLAEMTRSPINPYLSSFDSLLLQQQEQEYIQHETNLMLNPPHPKKHHQNFFDDSGRTQQRRRLHY